MRVAPGRAGLGLSIKRVNRRHHDLRNRVVTEWYQSIGSPVFCDIGASVSRVLRMGAETSVTYLREATEHVGSEFLFFDPSCVVLVSVSEKLMVSLLRDGAYSLVDDEDPPRGVYDTTFERREGCSCRFLKLIRVQLGFTVAPC